MSQSTHLHQGFICQSQGAAALTAEPQDSGERHPCPDLMVETEPKKMAGRRAGRASARSLAMSLRGCLVTQEEPAYACHPFRDQFARSIRQFSRERGASVCHRQRLLVRGCLGMKSVESTNQTEFAMLVASLLRQIDGPGKCGFHDAGIRLGKHHGQCQRCLKLHFTTKIDSIRAERPKRALDPRPALIDAR